MCLFVGRLVGWLAGWLVGWLVGWFWLVGCGWMWLVLVGCGWLVVVGLVVCGGGVDVVVDVDVVAVAAVGFQSFGVASRQLDMLLER